jgi:hypothetical protein
MKKVHWPALCSFIDSWVDLQKEVKGLELAYAERPKRMTSQAEADRIFQLWEQLESLKLQARTCHERIIGMMDSDFNGMRILTERYTVYVSWNGLGGYLTKINV